MPIDKIITPLYRWNMLDDPIDSLHDMLRQEPAMIVHFSGCPKGVGRDVFYPENLRFTLTNFQEILSCSTVTPQTVWSATGSVGVVIGPVDVSGVICVSHQDMGSGASTEQRKAFDEPTKVADCRQSLNPSGVTPYNEWLIGPYRVIGLFVRPDAQIYLPHESLENQYKSINENDVKEDLGDYRVFSVCGNEFIELQADQSWKNLDMSTLY